MSMQQPLKARLSFEGGGSGGKELVKGNSEREAKVCDKVDQSKAPS